MKHKRSLCLCVSPEPSYIPELLLDTAVSLSEEAPVRPTVPHSPDPPEDPLDLEGQTGEPLVAMLFMQSFRWPMTDGHTAVNDHPKQNSPVIPGISLPQIHL